MDYDNVMNFLASVLVILIVACGTKAEPPTAERGEPDAAEKARLEAREAEQAAKEAIAKVDRLQKDADELDVKVSAAIDAVVASQTEADRANAQEKLTQLRKEKASLEHRLAEAQAKAARAKRMQGARVSRECLDNPLAKGCM